MANTTKIKLDTRRKFYPDTVGSTAEKNCAQFSQQYSSFVCSVRYTYSDLDHFFRWHNFQSFFLPQREI